MLAYNSPTNRRTWDPHGVYGWYIFIETDHYLCHKVYVPKTISECTTASVKLFPKKVEIPQNNIQEETIVEAKELIQVLRKNAQDDPMKSNNKNTISALKQLAYIFLQRATASKYNPPGQQQIHHVLAINLRG